MKMKKLAYVIASVGLSALLAGPAMAVQGAKFAAHVSVGDPYLLHSGVADTTLPATSESECTKSAFTTWDPVAAICYQADNDADLLNQTIHVGSQKDLLVGVSLESGLYTDTTVRGKNGSSEKAGAEAGIVVRLEISGLDADGNQAKAYPEAVVFNKRVQELSATLGGVIDSCEVKVNTDTGEGTIDISEDCVVDPEEIGLILSTTSANHYNFIVPDLAAGDHTVTVNVEALSSAAVQNGVLLSIDTIDEETECLQAGGSWNGTTSECEIISGEAKAWGVVNLGTLTVEEVRANKIGGIDIDLP